MKRAKGAVYVIFFAFLWFLMSDTARAGVRCGTAVVTEGDTAYEVFGSCGEPQFVESWEEERIKRDFYPYSSVNNNPYWNRNAYRQPYLVKEHVVIERWTYSFGSNRFIHYLIFENGVLTKISFGPRSRF